MKDEQTKAAIKQALIPMLALVAAVIVMLFVYASRISKAETENVADSLVHIAEDYGTEAGNELAQMSAAGRPVAGLMKEYMDSDNQIVVKIADSLLANTEAYAMVYYTGEEGILHDGTKVNIQEKTYFSQLEEKMKVQEAYNAVEYIYVPDDELGFEKKAVVAIISVDDEEYTDKLFLYYPMERIKKLFKMSELDAKNFYAIVDSTGLIMEQSGMQSNFLETGNLWEKVRAGADNDSGAVAGIVSRMRNRFGGTIQAIVGGEERTLVCGPIGINDWAVIIGVNQTYVDSLLDTRMNSTRQMITQLSIAVLIFLIVVVITSVINRIRNRQKSEELEKKADTDLLTGLNNKLATERKIKDYIKTNPDDQALMFILDIDNFKNINDTLGHAFGDEVLRSLGHSLGALFRATDVVGRAGGDEFIILLKHLKDEELLEREAKKLCNFFKDFHAGEYVKYAATASIGAAVFPKDGKDFESLYKAADSALYIAKKRGKAQLTFYGDEKDKSEGKKRVEEESRCRK